MLVSVLVLCNGMQQALGSAEHVTGAECSHIQMVPWTLFHNFVLCLTCSADLGWLCSRILERSRARQVSLCQPSRDA
jgi:hypothetical protein